MIRRLALFSLLGIIACGGPSRGAPLERVTVPPGASLGLVADTLLARGVVGSRLWFVVVGRLKGADRTIKPGTYDFRRGERTGRILADLVNGRVATNRFTVPEGLAIPEIAALGAERLGLPAESLVAAATDPAEIAQLGIRARSLEGFLLPETYLVPLDYSARDLVRLLRRGFDQNWMPAWNARLDTLRLTRLQLVTLASIVEGEAVRDGEREIIAGVYYNRLRLGMALEADPTVQYAILLKTGKRKKRLFHRDLEFPSPYNTYLHRGLPPGPIDNPGRRSLEATLYPANVPYLFFVAGPDGKSVFSRTYREHLKAVADAQKAWRDARARQR